MAQLVRGNPATDFPSFLASMSFLREAIAEVKEKDKMEKEDKEEQRAAKRGGEEGGEGGHEEEKRRRMEKDVVAEMEKEEAEKMEAEEESWRRWRRKMLVAEMAKTVDEMATTMAKTLEALS